MPRALTKESLLAHTARRQLPGVDGECWEWQGGKWGSTNYGSTYIGIVDGKVRHARVHRLIYELTVGPIPDGQYIAHMCDNPICCRPSHLWIGTAAQNQHDKAAKGRAKNKHLTPDQVRAIRAQHAAGATWRALANEYGVIPKTIWNIIRGKTWTKLD